MPESLSIKRERPLEPDTDNSDGGNRELTRKGDRILIRDAVFYFMRLKINGEDRENIKAETVQELLEELKITEGRVAVEVNMVIVRRTEYAQFRLHEKDVVEIVNFVGGGS